MPEKLLDLMAAAGLAEPEGTAAEASPRPSQDGTYEVLSWDATRIRCRSATHRSPDNPLRLHGRLGAACGIEYAAQAMAVHGALVAASAPLARVRSPRTTRNRKRNTRGAHTAPFNICGQSVEAIQPVTPNAVPASREAALLCFRSRQSR